MDQVELTTVRSLKCAIRIAKTIMVQVRFGCSERWTKLSKLEALGLVSGIGSDDTTPEHFEMFTGVFGTYDTSSKTLYLG